MRMAAPPTAPSVQPQAEEEELQMKPAITPLIQREAMTEEV
jgi:hypothetical protein